MKKTNMALGNGAEEHLGYDSERLNSPGEGMPVYLKALIIAGSLLLVTLTFFCMWRFCCKKKRKSLAFAWLDRLGIPYAREGVPDFNTLPRAGIQVNNNNPKKLPIAAKNSSEVFPVTAENSSEVSTQPGEDNVAYTPECEDDPFKHLDSLGIPQARIIDTNVIGVEGGTRARPPSTPLPSLIDMKASLDNVFDTETDLQFEDGNSNVLDSDTILQFEDLNAMPSPPTDYLD